MKIGNFLFPDSRDPARDGVVIDETLREARLSDDLGVDVIWLAEHHFDGICAYVDPVTFAGAIVATTRRATIGFAVVQVSLHHPIRLAEQIALIDNIANGRLIVGLGRGSSFNIYDYQGFGIDHHEAQERLEEAEAIMRRAWAGDEFAHRGKYWNLQVPMLRPRPYTKPHPPLIRAVSREASLLALAREGQPFLMNVQPLAVTRHRVELYRQVMGEAGYDDARIVRTLGRSWVWRNIFVAETDAEAERVGRPAYQAMSRSRAEMRNRLYRETGQRIDVPASELPDARAHAEDAIICGSPATVAEKLAGIAALGIGGVIATFRLGPLSYDETAASLRLFTQRVAPTLRG